MSKYLLRLDDASEYMDVTKWERMELLLDRYGVKPIVGIIPQNRDKSLVESFSLDPGFWGKANQWMTKGWALAQHGYEHCYVTQSGGINPVNKRSEFAGLPYEEQAEKIANGYASLAAHGIAPRIFFAPSHTFDDNTLKAIFDKTPIRIISDTIANDVYYQNEFWFIPQQSGRVRKLPFATVTFCYHPNTMNDQAFEELENFLKQCKFTNVDELEFRMKNRSLLDNILRWLYFIRR